MNRELEDLILAITLENSIRYGGKANKGSVIGKFLYIRPEYRGKIGEVIALIDAIIARVNKLTLDEQKDLFEKLSDLLPEKKEKEEELPPLPDAVKGKVTTRFAPNPDFVLHLGSVRPLLFSYLYAKKYEGKFILRFEDTDPRTKRPREEYYKLILKDIKWLGTEPDEIYYQSDRLNIYYDVARELIERGNAYVCRCKRNEFKRYVSMGKPCPDRERGVDENHDLFEAMVNGDLPEGAAILRIKTDLSHPNPSIRDWPALRIIDTRKYPHPRSGSEYYVWPLYNFSCPIDDHYMGVTHVIRGAEHRVNEEKQAYIYRYMGWKPPFAIHHGRVSIPSGVLSKSKILDGIKKGVYSGIDDPRLATLAALRRRGFRPEAIKRVILRGGLKASLSTIDWSLLAAENRSLVDRDANRYFVVRNPFKASFKLDVGRIEVKIRKHPDYPGRGVRIFVLESIGGVYSVLIDEKDRDHLTIGNVIRLIGLGNFKVSGIDPEIGLDYVDNDVSRARRGRYPFIHWVPVREHVDVQLIYPGDVLKGCGEVHIRGENVDNIVQLERLGYFRIDDITDVSIRLIFAHN